MTLLQRMADVVGLMATPLRPSHYTELVYPLWSSHRLQARVEGVWDETRDARTLTLRPGRGFRVHRAGQHVRVGVTLDGRRMTRTYSISSSPDRDDGCFTITVKTCEGARVSRFLARDVRPGAFLSVELPQGDFCLPDSTPVRPLFITAGSGITPVMSMLRTLALRDRMPDSVHIHYAPRARDVIFGGELERIAAEHPRYRLRCVYTRDGVSRSASYFTAQQLEELCPDWRERDVWACGPQDLLDALGAHFERAGRPERLHVERFTARVAPLSANAIGGTVHFRRSGLETRADGKKVLLRVAEDAGIGAPHGCRMGVCHTCDATMLAGCVRDIRSGREINEPGTRIQLCVCAAAGDVEIEL